VTARVATVLLVVMTALISGCLPAAASSQGRDVAALYTVFIAIAAVVAIIVFGGTTWSVLRYRRRRDEPAGTLPPQIHGSLRLESTWTAIPIITVLVLFGATMLVLDRIQATSASPGAVIRVEAFRWGWTFRYPEVGITVSGIGSPGPEIVVPVGEPVRVTVSSHDVVHSFYVPQFLFKRDAVPGRESSFDFTVEDAGTYRGQCAEFCGIYHSRMPFSVRAVSRADYDAWVASQPKSSPAPAS
jgi:cytochrome c oxidase subunit 2